MKLAPLLLGIIFGSAGLLAQGNLNKERVFSHVIASKALGEDRDIQVYLPASSEDKTHSYPVLYVLDGQQYFYNGVAYEKSFTHFDRAPEFMVVGIENYHPNRIEKLYDTKFADFLEQELIPFIEAKYPASDDRLIFGWQSAGMCATYLLLNRPHLFNAYFAASGVTGSLDSEALDKLLSDENVKQPKYVYFTLGAGEHWFEKRSQAFSNFLADRAGTNLKWNYELLEEDDHWSTPYRTIYRGLLNYYHDFEPLRFKSLAEVQERGGLKGLEKHFAARGERYGTSKEIHRRTVFHLLRLAMKEDNYTYFDHVMTRYGSNQFSDWYKWDHWSRHLHRYGRFYLKHKHPEKALAVFQKTQQKFPKEAVSYHAIGDAYKAKGDLDQARSSYKQAIDVATKTADRSLKDYQAALEALNP